MDALAAAAVAIPGRVGADLWGEVSARLFGFDRRLVKEVAMLVSYGGSWDPWVDHLVMTEVRRALSAADNDVSRYRRLVFTGD